MLTHTHRHNHAAEFVNEGVGGSKHSTNIYAEITDFYVGE